MNKKFFFPIVASIVILLVPLLPAQSTQNNKIFQTDKDILIDGKLEDWDSIQALPVNLLPDGTEISGSESLDVWVKFTYDPANFYAAVRAVDDQFEFPSRSWRYGDGLYLTFVNPHQGNESDQFWTFGFSLEEGKKIAVLVNRDGTYFPGLSTENIKVEISADTANKVIVYEMAIPWNIITPVKPFIDAEWGINVIYVDQDQGKREIRQLYPDPNYDTEETNKRKGEIFTFVNHLPQNPEFQSQFSGSHFYSDQDKVLAVAINSPSEASGWNIKYVVSSARKNFTEREPISLSKGLNLIRHALPEDNYPAGLYDISLAIIDNQRKLRYTENHTFFIVNRTDLESLAKSIAEIKSGKQYAEDPKFQNSFPALEIRLQWIQEFAQTAHSYADIRDLREWREEMDLLFRNVQNGEPALFPPGSLGRLAHRSKIDGTLQPYSVFVPGDYDGKNAIPLLVTLHGSGVDERQSVLAVARGFGMAMAQRKISRMIIIAPKARELSSWYLGDSGKDVLECIEHIKTLYNIDSKRIVCDGFSMGGYGAWRLSLLNPDLFRGAIIRSGAITPPQSLGGENIVDLIKPGLKVSYLIIHGDSDNAVPVSNARAAVKKLKEMKIDYRYIEVKGAAHGNYERWNDIISWLRRILSFFR